MAVSAVETGEGDKHSHALFGWDEEAGGASSN